MNEMPRALECLKKRRHEKLKIVSKYSDDGLSFAGLRAWYQKNRIVLFSIWLTGRLLPRLTPPLRADPGSLAKWEGYYFPSGR